LEEEIMRRRSANPVPKALVEQIEAALARVDEARAERDVAVSEEAPLRARRRLNAALTRAFEVADALLRTATETARQRGCTAPAFVQWSQWRRRLSRLDTAFQIHLFAESDDLPSLALGEIRAIDTGLSGPSIGDLMHGESRPPMTAPRYGLDMAAVMGTATGYDPVAEREPASVLPLPVPVPAEPEAA
jgi:hypothetical protein